jgi:SRSO17 transposase
VYGTGKIETLLRKAGKGYVLGVASNHVFRSWGKQQSIAGTASAIARSLPKKAWRRLPSGEGTKGPRWHDWTSLELADLDASDTTAILPGNGREAF